MDGGRFVSPIGQTDDTVFATWEVKELREEGRGDDENLVWKTIRSGIDSRPFHLDDGTSQIQVAIEDRPADVTSKFEEDPVVERVNVDSIPPMHIRTFAQERDLPEPVEPSTTAQIFDINRPDADIGDRRYSESTLGSGDEIYVLGQVRAVEGATTPLHSEDAVITLAEDETFVISDLPEDELTQQISSDYRSMIALGALFFTIGAGLLVIAISFL